jgi:hypothetical protein
VHQLQGRVLAFIVTYALHEALTEWMQAPNYELPDEAWHVTAYYKNIHDKVAASTFTDKFCEEKGLPLPVCRVAMTARSKNAPSARPCETNIRSIMKVGTTGSVYKPVPSLMSIIPFWILPRESWLYWPLLRMELNLLQIWHEFETRMQP